MKSKKTYTNIRKVKRVGLEPRIRTSRQMKIPKQDLVDVLQKAMPVLMACALGQLVFNMVWNGMNNIPIGQEEKMMKAAEMPQPLA